MIFATFDLDSINSKYMPGVVVPSVLGGISAEEILEIAQIIGQCKKVRLVDLSEFNPLVESVVSSRLMSYMFY